LNGFHETFRIRHAEDAYGFATVGQTIQAIPEPVLRLSVNGVWLRQGSAVLEDDRRTLDFRTGEVSGEQVWHVPEAGRVRVAVRRFVAMFEAGLALRQVEVTALDVPAEVRFAAALELFTASPDAAVAEDQALADPRLGERASGGGLEPVGEWGLDGCYCQALRCRNSRLAVAVGVRHEMDSAAMLAVGVDHETGSAATVAAGVCHETDSRAVLAPGETLRLTTYFAAHADLVPPLGVLEGLAVTADQPVAALVARCQDTLAGAVARGVDALLREQTAWLADFWERADVVVKTGDSVVRDSGVQDSGVQDAEVGEAKDGVSIGADGGVQQAIRWELFQLAQVSAQLAGHGIAAKGLTGSGYSGHYFWDSEIFVLPFLTYCAPAAARAALEFRHAMLPAARRRAAMLDVAGALFPWRTINGEEASAYYPAGTAQYHIDADIAYATAQYVAVTGDREFLASYGVDILVETARMWASLGFIGGDGAFHIHGVTGPDEYSAVVDDNLYTNAMAGFNLEAAAEACAALRSENPAGWAAARDRLAIWPDEPDRWRDTAALVNLAWDEARGVHPQDAGFLDRQPWDFSAAAQKRPLLLHYHPLVIYRHQVLKQADTVLALLLLPDRFSPAQKRADFDYYDPLTTGDSTLSVAIQAAVAAEVGQEQLALDYFGSALRIDLEDLHANSASGVHVASAGGVWTALVRGFGGLRDCADAPTLDPRLPAGWESLEFNLTVKGKRSRVRITHAGVECLQLESAG
jgi:alpha,alpha-trehalose phosphorylase